MKPVKVTLTFEEDTTAVEMWAFIKTLQQTELIHVPVVVAKLHYAAGIVDNEESILPLLRAAERAKLRVEFRFE